MFITYLVGLLAVVLVTSLVLYGSLLVFLISYSLIFVYLPHFYSWMALADDSFLSINLVLTVVFVTESFLIFN